MKKIDGKKLGVYICLNVRECLIILSILNLKIRVSRCVLFLTKNDLKDYIFISIL